MLFQLRTRDAWIPAELNAPPEFFFALERVGIEFVPLHDEVPAAFTMHTDQAAMHFSGPAFLQPLQTNGWDSAVSAVMAGLVAGHAANAPSGLLCLHAAAAQVNGRGILIPALFRSGKSSLSCALAFLGADIISDDAIELDCRSGTIRAFGLPLRIRRGFLTSASPQLRRWIEAKTVFEGDRYIFIRPHANEQISARMSDVLFIDRREPETTEIVIRQAYATKALSRLSWHNLARGHSPTHILANLTHALAGVSVHELSYGNTQAAAEWISAWSGQISPAHNATSPIAPGVMDEGDRFSIHHTEGAVFVGDEATGYIVELSESAYVCWKLAREFETRALIAEALRVLYPQSSETERLETFDDALRKLVSLRLLTPSQAANFSN